MNYLCLHHRVQVARSAEVAQQLWLGAFRHGQEAFLMQQWQAAEGFFGSAFDIAKVRVNDFCRGQLSAFDEAQLVASADFLSQTLSQLGKYAQADSVIQYVRHHLLRKLAHEKSTANKSANLKQYLKLIDVTGLKIAELHHSEKVRVKTYRDGFYSLRILH